MSSERGVEEAIVASLPPPPRVETYPTSTDINTATMSTTVTTTTTRTTTPNFFSPLKRKRDRSPFEIPSAPWRLQSAPVDEDDEERSEVVEVELEVDVDDVEARESSGQASPRSRKLASQLEDLSLAASGPPLILLQQSGGDLEMETEVTMIATMEEPTAKKPKRKTRTIATIAEDGTKKKPGMTKIRVYENRDASMDGNENENGNTNPEVAVKQVGGREWQDKPSPASPREEVEMDGNNNTKRVRLRSPPLSKTKDLCIGEDDDDVGSAVVDESEDVDSDDPEKSGIGYRPTPTQRYVRSQKRMQQIKEYKARISKEAREKRSESRRRRRSFPDRYTVAAGSSAPNSGSDEGGRKKTVQFKIDSVV